MSKRAQFFVTMLILVCVVVGTTLAVTQDAYDAGVVSLDAPPEWVMPDCTYSVLATIRNYGDAELDTITGTCLIGTVTDTLYLGFGIVLGLAPGVDTQMMFLPWTVPWPIADSVRMMVTVAATGDTLTDNNSLSKTLYVDKGDSFPGILDTAVI